VLVSRETKRPQRSLSFPRWESFFNIVGTVTVHGGWTAGKQWLIDYGTTLTVSESLDKYPFLKNPRTRLQAASEAWY